MTHKSEQTCRHCHKNLGWPKYYFLCMQWIVIWLENQLATNDRYVGGGGCGQLCVRSMWARGRQDGVHMQLSCLEYNDTECLSVCRYPYLFSSIFMWRFISNVVPKALFGAHVHVWLLLTFSLCPVSNISQINELNNTYDMHWMYSEKKCMHTQTNAQ